MSLYNLFVECRVLVASLDKIDAESLKAAAEHLLSKLGDPAAVVVGSSPGDGKVSLVATFRQENSWAPLQKFVEGVVVVGGPTSPRQAAGNLRIWRKHWRRQKKISRSS
jgi:alanyl-tRNA synthetase